MTGEPGDIVAIPFPYTDLTTQKRRPVILLTHPDDHGDFIALAVTSVPASERALPLTNDDLVDGSLPKASWIRCGKLFTLQVELIVKRYGRLSEGKQGEIRDIMCPLLGCPKLSTRNP